MSCSPTFPQEDVSRVAEDVFEGTHIVLAYAYGSRVAGNASTASDLDVGYFLSEGHAAHLFLFMTKWFSQIECRDGLEWRLI